MMGTKMLKEILHSRKPKILYHHKNPTLDTIHMLLNLLIFSPWPFNSMLLPQSEKCLV